MRFSLFRRLPAVLLWVALSLAAFSLIACGGEPKPDVKTLPIEQGCADATLLLNDTDPSKRGPWKVGTRTVTLNKLTVEILYPAATGSEEGKEKVRFDLRTHLPDKEQDKISDKDNPWQECDCFRDLPVDKARGPYPVVLFIHGTAGFRTQSLAHMVHWASRGFIVVAADHKGLNLKDALALRFEPMADRQGKELLATLRQKPKALSFLEGRMDTSRFAVAGHSAGGNAVAALGKEPGVQVVIPMAAGGGVKTGDNPVSTLILGGVDDKVVPWSSQQKSYEQSPVVKRLLGLKKAGHLAFSDLCVIGQDKGGLLKIAQESGVEIPALFKGMIDTLATDGCKEGQLNAQQGWEVIHAATSAVMEEKLHCKPARAAQFSGLGQRYPKIVEGLKEAKK